jgi:hypothetical protein
MAALAGLESMPEGLWPSIGDPRVKALVPQAGVSYVFGENGLAAITVPMLAMGDQLILERLPIGALFPRMKVYPAKKGFSCLREWRTSNFCVALRRYALVRGYGLVFCVF